MFVNQYTHGHYTGHTVQLGTGGAKRRHSSASGIRRHSNTSTAPSPSPSPSPSIHISNRLSTISLSPSPSPSRSPSSSPISPVSPCNYPSHSPREHKFTGIPPPEDSDAQEIFWRISNTPMKNPNLPDQDKLFRIDDKEQNTGVDPAEAERRQKRMRSVLRTLGRGVAGWQAVEAQAYDKRPRVSVGSLLPSHCAANCPKGKRRHWHGLARLPSSDVILEALPENYSVFNVKRQLYDQATGAPTDVTFDLYICGCPGGIFNSAYSFIPHLHWLYYGRASGERCRCAICCKCLHCRGKCGRRSCNGYIFRRPNGKFYHPSGPRDATRGGAMDPNDSSSPSPLRSPSIMTVKFEPDDSVTLYTRPSSSTTQFDQRPRSLSTPIPSISSPF